MKRAWMCDTWQLTQKWHINQQHINQNKLNWLEGQVTSWAFFLSILPYILSIHSSMENSKNALKRSLQFWALVASSGVFPIKNTSELLKVNLRNLIIKYDVFVETLRFSCKDTLGLAKDTSAHHKNILRPLLLRPLPLWLRPIFLSW